MEMRELLELQTGQVAFISGLMSGFSLSIAAQVLRFGVRRRREQAVFILFLLCSLLFLLALYIDVRLSIELAGFSDLPKVLQLQISSIRVIGTSSATCALVLFIVATGLLGWLATPFTGALSTIISALVLASWWHVWQSINAISGNLAGL
jgi:hypothetical protein